MSYHLRLEKALSYSGIVKATRQHPDVFVEDKAVADQAVGSGYFRLIDDTAENALEQPAHLDKSQLDYMKLDELKQLAEDMGINTSGFKKKSDYTEAISQQEVSVDVTADFEEDITE